MLHVVEALGYATETRKRNVEDSPDNSMWQAEASPLHAAGRCLMDLITAKQVDKAAHL